MEWRHAVVEFYKKVWRMLQEQEYKYVAVLDETSVPFEPLGDRTLAPIGVFPTSWLRHCVVSFIVR